MNSSWKKYQKDKFLLLKDFNNRNSDAFSYIYNNNYNEFHLYAASLYTGTTVEPKDAVQDVFLYILNNSSVTFKELINIKAYVIIMLKNRYKNYLQHMDCERRYNEKLTDVDSTFEIDVLENKLYTMIDQMLSILPKDNAEIIKLYIEGWKPEEIAEKLQKPIQTVYNKKSESISILRRKVSKDMLLIFIILVGLGGSQS